MEIDISGIDKAELLAALYNEARPLGLGYLHYDPTPMTREQALEIMEKGDDHAQMFSSMVRGRGNLYFDYVKGRPLKVNLEGDTLSTHLYDRDQGEGAAARVVAELRARQ